MVTNEEHRFLVQDQPGERMGVAGTLLLEPMVRDTAPELMLAAPQARDKGKDPISRQ